VRGKAEERRGSVQIVCDNISTEFPMFTASGEQSNGYHHEPSAYPDDADADVPPPIDFSEYDGPADAPPYEEDTHNGTPEDEPLEEYTPNPRLAVGFPSHEGEIDWDSELEGDPHLNGDKPKPKTRWRICVFFERVEDNDVNTRRLRRIHGTFTSFPGDDEFCIVIEAAGQRYALEFPQAGTHACDELYQSLAKIVGDANIAWEEINENP
jgi:hypothetical protein